MARVRGRQARRRLRPHRPQAQAAGHRVAQGARLRRDRRGAPRAHHRRAGSPVRVDAQHARQGPHGQRRRSLHRHLPQAAPGRTAHARLRACAAREPVLQHQALRPGEGRPAQGLEEAVEGVPAPRPEALRPRDPERQRRRSQRRLHAHQGRHPRDGLVPREAAQPRRRLLPRRHRPLRQPPGAHRRRAHPEPAPRRPQPHGARRARAHDDPGRRGDHAADAHQHPARGRGDQGILRFLAAVAVHGPDQPARGSHAQAAPLGARAGRSVA